MENSSYGGIRPMRNLSTKYVANALGLEFKRDRPISMYAIDSRLIEPEGLFFAIKGEHFDGHDFVQEAKAKGAIAVVVSQSADIEGIEVFQVPDVAKALQTLAKKVYSEKKCPVIGVTGSVGKTMTKEFIAQSLDGALKVYKSPASFNSQLTLPISVLNCPETAEICVLEYAMSEKGQIAKLVAIAPPDIGVITPIGLSHAENFANVEEIAQEKSCLFKSENMVQGFVHAKSWDLVKNVGDFPKEKYGERPDGPFDESHLNENYDAAKRVGCYLGISSLKIPQRPAKRFEVIEKSGITYVNDSYNASLISFEAALSNLPKGKRKVGVIGSIKELGVHSKMCHQKLSSMADQALDEIFCIGEECQIICDLLGNKAKLYGSFEALKKALEANVQQGDVVLIKGSNSHQLWRLVEF